MTFVCVVKFTMENVARENWFMGSASDIRFVSEVRTF